MYLKILFFVVTGKFQNIFYRQYNFIKNFRTLVKVCLLSDVPGFSGDTDTCCQCVICVC